MSDTNPDQDVVTPAGNGRRQRGRLATRAAVATVIAGGLAAGSYGIASAASGRVAAGTSASQALAARGRRSRPFRGSAARELAAPMASVTSESVVEPSAPDRPARSRR
jgi:hypothetical protein